LLKTRNVNHNSIVQVSYIFTIICVNVNMDKRQISVTEPMKK